MTIERNPVPKGKYSLRLRCMDFDASGARIGDECEQKRLEFAQKQEERLALGMKPKKFRCPNRVKKTGQCSTWAFLYPRKWSTKGFFHYHQGIDIFAPSGTPIESVTHGTVIEVKTWDKVSDGYGNVVAIYDEHTNLTFWYAHCENVFVAKGIKVVERQVIATVGDSGFADEPHLHFETLDGRWTDVGGHKHERELGNPRGPRLDPFDVLESLGPWSSRQLHEPRGSAITSRRVALLHAEVSASPFGGHYPLGANNLWHGGVHLRMPLRSELHAPFDGEIVAVRIDPDPATATGHFGSTNFILLRHELPAAVFDRLRRRDPADPTAPSRPAPRRSVGLGGTNAPDDVLAVKAALAERRGADGQPFYVPGDPDPLDDAIRAFQATLESPYSDPSDPWPDGIITVGGHTWRHLFPADPTEPAALDPHRTLYSLFMHVAAVEITAALTTQIPWLRRLGKRDPDALAGVITGLRIPVRANEVLWLSGEAAGTKADGTATLLPQVHWELFSEHPLVAAWAEAALVDDTNDLSLDVPERIYDAAEIGGKPGFEKDHLLRAAEITEFYASPRCHFLRRTPVKFRSEWGLDIDAAVARIASMRIDTTGLAEQLRPYTWWPLAADVLPASPLVWHYDPIEFLGLYQSHLDALAPPPPPDPATEGTLEVTVLHDNRVEMKRATVELACNGTTTTLRTGTDGKATFFGVPRGSCTARVVDATHPPVAATIEPAKTSRITILTEIPGPPPKHGSLHVTVRKHTNKRAPGIEVELRSPVGGPVAVVKTTDHGERGNAWFERVQYGEYTIHAGKARPVTIAIRKKKNTAKAIVLPPPLGVLKVTLQTPDEAPTGAGEAIRIEQGGRSVLDEPLHANDEGIGIVTLPESRYRVRVAGRSRSTLVKGNALTPLTITIDGPPIEAPVEPEGLLSVVVTRDGVEIVGEHVVVCDPSECLVDAMPTDPDGVAAFTLPPGPYVVSAGDAAGEATVVAFTGVSLALALEV